MNLLKITVLFLLCFFSKKVFPQYQVTIEAHVVDKYSKEPLPFVDIYFKGKQIKTVTDEKGYFKLSYNESSVNENDSIEFVLMGYKTQTATTKQLYRFLKNSNILFLESKRINEKIKTLQGNIFGKVTSNNRPVLGATINVKNTLIETQTNSEGEFRIQAKEDDILQVSALGMLPKEVLISNQKNININLKPDGQLLEEVIVKGKAKKEKTINLGQAIKKGFDAIGTSVNVITAKDIPSNYTNLEDLLLGRFASLNHSREASINVLQGKIYDIDGMIFSSSDPIPKVDPQNIESLTILTSLAAVTKYGSLGRGGVIVIRTKTASGGKAAPKKPSALATGNTYEEQVQSINTLSTTPSYIKTLQNAISFDEAKQIYKQLKQTKDNLSIPFYLNAADYFFKWDNSYAMDILTYVEELAKDNAKALKTLAFKYEALNKLEKARLVYQRIAILRPTDAQSYRDLALIYNATGYYNEAMQLYKQMLGNSIEGADFSGLQQPIVDELMHLLAFHRSKVDYKGLPADLLAAKFKQDLRIVFEYNDPNAEFELQFVNPQKKFYKWSHTKFDNRERMLDEIQKGYTTEANIIDDAEPGEWLINIESLNETPDINPNYLKYTIYKNYGLPNETKTVKVIQLENIKQKVTLDRFLYK